MENKKRVWTLLTETIEQHRVVITVTMLYFKTILIKLYTYLDVNLGMQVLLSQHACILIPINVTIKGCLCKNWWEEYEETARFIIKRKKRIEEK